MPACPRPPITPRPVSSPARPSARPGCPEQLLRQILGQGPDQASPALFTESVASASAAQMAMVIRARGPNQTLTQREASDLLALGEAARWIRDERSRARARRRRRREHSDPPCPARSLPGSGARRPPRPGARPAVRSPPQRPHRRRRRRGLRSRERRRGGRARGAQPLCHLLAHGAAFDPTAPGPRLGPRRSRTREIAAPLSRSQRALARSRSTSSSPAPPARARETGSRRSRCAPPGSPGSCRRCRSERARPAEYGGGFLAAGPGGRRRRPARPDRRLSRARSRARPLPLDGRRACRAPRQPPHRARLGRCRRLGAGRAPGRQARTSRTARRITLRRALPIPPRPRLSPAVGLSADAPRPLLVHHLEPCPAPGRRGGGEAHGARPRAACRGRLGGDRPEREGARAPARHLLAALGERQR